MLPLPLPPAFPLLLKVTFSKLVSCKKILVATWSCTMNLVCSSTLAVTMMLALASESSTSLIKTAKSESTLLVNLSTLMMSQSRTPTTNREERTQTIQWPWTFLLLRNRLWSARSSLRASSAASDPAVCCQTATSNHLLGLSKETDSCLWGLRSKIMRELNSLHMNKCRWSRLKSVKDKKL